ncbi:protein fem-1 homolog CG6966-like [Macrobrachium nipponense]|uniref:protein fem-1 homolog CG6966-like n=1 Tax=Macrobrachium nipponense TaxID=159736 RepID=UPI0030C8AB94
MSATPRAEVVNLLLETGSDPSATDNEGNTPLHAIAKNEECPKGIVDALLSRGAHLDARNGQGQTFASLRADQGQPVSQLVNVVRHTSLQCLAAACIKSLPYGWSKASCIENGGMEWESLVNAAAVLGHATCVRILVDYHNANIEGLGLGHLEIVDFLLSKGANANGVTTFNSTPLAAACSHGHFEVARLLLEHGAYTDAADHHADTCLMLASCSGHLDIVKYLLNIGVDVNRRNIYGKSALYGSVESGNLEVMKALLSYNAILEADYSGTTPLMAASSRGHANIVEYLVSRTDVSRMEKIEALELLGASVLDKIRDAVGAVEYWKSALSLRYVDGALMYPKPDHHLSCPLCDEFGEFTTVQQLEDIENNNNAVYVQSLLVRERILGTDDAGTMRSFRSTGLDYARCGDLKLCISLWLHAISMQQLQLKPLDPSRLFHLQSFTEFWASQWCEVKIAVSRLVNMDPRDSTGSTLLHLACSLGVRDIGNLLLPISASLRTEIVDLLLETGSDPCAKDHAGNTPLHTLAWNEDVSESTVGALLSAGANLDDVNSRGETFGSLMASREQPLGQFVDTASHISVQCLVAE